MKIEQLLEANAGADRDARTTGLRVLKDIVQSIHRMDPHQFMKHINQVSDRTVDQFTLYDAWTMSVLHLTNRVYDNDDPDRPLYMFRLSISPQTENASISTEMGGHTITLPFDDIDVKSVVRHLGDKVYLYPDRVPEGTDIKLFSSRNTMELNYKLITETLLQSQHTIRMFIHEYVHLLDDRRSGGYVSNNPNYKMHTGSTNDNDAYYNQPVELNTFYQEAAHQLDQDWDRMSGGQKAFLLSDFDDFKKFVIRRYFDPNWYEALNPDSLRRVTKRLYQHWQDLLDESDD